MKLWLDDVRDPPEGESWIVERSGTPMFYHLARHASVISMDHDLGEDEDNGAQILAELERQAYTGLIWSTGAPELLVHSANPPGRANMEAAIASIYRKVGRKDANLIRDKAQEFYGRENVCVSCGWRPVACQGAKYCLTCTYEV